MLKYKANYCPPASGLVNFGNTCYLNALTQSLLSCSSFNEKIISIRKNHKFKENTTAMAYVSIFCDMMQERGDSRLIYNFWQNVLAKANERKDNVRFSHGQQDSHEFLLLLLDCLDEFQEIQDLFRHRVKIQALCELCNSVCLNKTEENLTFEVAPADVNSKLEKNLLKHYSEIDADHICEHCKKKSNKIKKVTLTMAPEIIVITINRYTSGGSDSYPEELQFPYKDHKSKLHYKLVAQCEQVGNMHGGHYRATCYRKGNVYLFDDSSYQLIGTDFGSRKTQSSYLLFYHYTGLVE